MDDASEYAALRRRQNTLAVWILLLVPRLWPVGLVLLVLAVFRALRWVVRLALRRLKIPANLHRNPRNM